MTPIAQTLRLLQSVQEHDVQIRQLRDQQKSAQQRLLGPQQKVNAARKRMEARREEHREIEKQAATADATVRALSDRIAELEKRRRAATSNKEYAAIDMQIAETAEERDSLETAWLEMQDTLEDMTVQIVELQSALATVEAALKAEQTKADRVTAEADTEIARHSAERDNIVAELPDEIRKTYTRLFEALPGNALALCTDDGICTGCQSRVTPQTKVRLLSGNEYVQCNVCSCFLYMESTFAEEGSA